MDVDDQAGSGRQDDEGLLSGPYWETPDLYGEAEALNSMGTIAAPLLAGFSLAAMVQTLTISPAEARWPDAALLLFMLAAALFIATVQAMFWARGYQASPPDITAWWPDAGSTRRLELLRDDQKWHAAGFRMWSNRARVTYSAALLCLLAALAVLAVPAHSERHFPIMRWLAVAFGVCAFIAEAAWIIGSFFPTTKWAVRLLAPQAQLDNPSSDIGEQ